MTATDEKNKNLEKVVAIHTHLHLEQENDGIDLEKAHSENKKKSKEENKKNWRAILYSVGLVDVVLLFVFLGGVAGIIVGLHYWFRFASPSA